MTVALEGGEWSAAHPGRTLPPGKDPVHIVQEAGWAPGSVWTGRKSRPHRDSIPDHPAHSQSLYRLSYLTHWSCPEGSRKLRFPDFVTMADDGGKFVSPMHQLFLPPGNNPGTHVC